MEYLVSSQGFKGDGIHCEEVKSDPCIEDKNPCHPESTCLSVNGMATCGPCPLGMKGNGKVCHHSITSAHNRTAASADPCSDKACFEGVDCLVSHDGESCKCGDCPKGLVGNGIHCTKAKMPNKCIDNPCFEGKNTNTFAC